MTVGNHTLESAVNNLGREHFVGLDEITEFCNPKEPDLPYYHCGLSDCYNEQGKTRQMIKHLKSYAHRQSWLKEKLNIIYDDRESIDNWFKQNTFDETNYRTVTDFLMWFMCKRALLRKQYLYNKNMTRLAFIKIIEDQLEEFPIETLYQEYPHHEIFVSPFSDSNDTNRTKSYEDNVDPSRILSTLALESESIPVPEPPNESVVKDANAKSTQANDDTKENSQSMVMKVEQTEKDTKQQISKSTLLTVVKHEEKVKPEGPRDLLRPEDGSTEAEVPVVEKENLANPEYEYKQHVRDVMNGELQKYYTLNTHPEKIVEEKIKNELEYNKICRYLSQQFREEVRGSWMYERGMCAEPGKVFTPDLTCEEICAYSIEVFVMKYFESSEHYQDILKQRKKDKQ